MNIIIAIFILGIIVIVHELGHFLLAKKNGITVTEFSVGMGPRIASFVRGGTRYSLKLLPIGGSCMMLGEDETVEDEGAFHKKGVWARFSVIFAGAFFNFILAFILALIVLSNTGADKPYVTEVKSGSPADGKLQEGDLITRIERNSINVSRELWFYYNFNAITEDPINISYIRAGKKYKTTITPAWKDAYKLGINYDENMKQAVLDYVVKDYPLGEAGIVEGDVIVGIDGNAITSGRELNDYIDKNPLTDKAVTISYKQGGKGETKTVKVTPKLESSGYSMGWNYNIYQREKVPALQVAKYAFYELKYNIDSTLKSVLYLITGRVSVKQIAGPVGLVNFVGDIVTESKGYGLPALLLSLMNFSILISANLGVMNLLPLPALDGGRLVFLLIEAIRRKPVPKEKEAIVHMVGMALLMILMVFVMFNDIRNIIG